MIEFEKRLQNVDDKIKSFKSALPVAGSLVDFYIYTKTATKTYGYGVVGTWIVRFTPDDPEQGLGITEIGVLVEADSTASGLIPSNPQYTYAQNGYYVVTVGNLAAGSQGLVFYSNSSYPNDGYIARIKANVYSTVPGTVTITLI